MSCEHQNFHAVAEISRCTRSDTDPTVVAFYCDLKIRCLDCNIPFEFIGLPMGLSPGQPRCSVDAQEARMPIKPVGGFKGICRFCGCTESNACVDATDRPCSWFNPEQTVCTTRSCVLAYRDSRAGENFIQPAFLHEIQRHLADTQAKSLIDSNCFEEEPNWLNLSSTDLDLTIELIYLEMRGILERHPSRIDLVRFHG